MPDGIGPFDTRQVERARAYHRPLYLAALAGLALDLAVLAALSFTALGGRLYSLVGGWPWWARGLAFSSLVVSLTEAVDLPIGFWRGYVHEHAWALSTQSLAGWLLDRLKRLVIGLLLVTGALLGLVAAARVWPSAWPVVVATLAACVVLALTFVGPLVLEPLFSRFGPLADSALAASLTALAARAGVELEEILVAQASRKTRKLNAYVSGLGRTRRLVLFDTLLARADAREARVVVAHELGHRRAGHVVKSMLLAMCGAVAFVIALWALLRWATLRSELGVSGPDDPRLVPFALLLASALGLLTSPLGAALSRRWEREADAFSLRLTGDPAAFEATHRRLALANLADLDPPRLAYLTWFSHPTPPERIAGARAVEEAR